MKVFTYSSADAPPEHRAVARIRCAFPGKRGATVEDWHPVIFHGSTEEGVRERALAWWAAELAKEDRRQAGYAKSAATRRARANPSAPMSGRAA